MLLSIPFFSLMISVRAAKIANISLCSWESGLNLSINLKLFKESETWLHTINYREKNHFTYFEKVMLVQALKFVANDWQVLMDFCSFHKTSSLSLILKVFKFPANSLMLESFFEINVSCNSSCFESTSEVNPEARAESIEMTIYYSIFYWRVLQHKKKSFI